MSDLENTPNDECQEEIRVPDEKVDYDGGSINPFNLDRLNAELPNDPLPTGIEYLNSLKGFPQGKLMVLTASPARDPNLGLMAILRRIVLEGSPVISPWPVGDGIPSTRCEVLKARPKGTKQFAFDYSSPVQFIDLDWRPCEYEQALDRSQRKVHLNVIRRASPQASRNEREGVYAFKVKGRHTRKKRTPKVEVMAMNASALERIEEQVCK